MTAQANELAHQLIKLAEGLLGPKVEGWAFRGVEFSDAAPHLVYYPDEQELAISLSFRALDDDLQLVFQLAHEVCHLLYPSVRLDSPKKPQTNVINEGISTWFSILMVNHYFGAEAAADASDSLYNSSFAYFSAFASILQLLDHDADALIKIRAVQPEINNLTRGDVKRALPGVDETLIEELIRRF